MIVLRFWPSWEVLLDYVRNVVAYPATDQVLTDWLLGERLVTITGRGFALLVHDSALLTSWGSRAA